MSSINEICNTLDSLTNIKQVELMHCVSQYPFDSQHASLNLIKALKDGTIDCIATDHAPHTIEEKEATFDLAPFGMIGLESCFGAVYKVMVKKNNMNRIDLLKTLTINPRKIMGFEHDLFKKGREAEITVFDPNENWIFNNDDIYSKSKNSPFVGKELIGRVKYTIIKNHLRLKHLNFVV